MFFRTTSTFRIHRPFTMEALRLAIAQPFDYLKAREYSAAIQGPTLWITLLYVVSVFGTKTYMKDRKPLDVSLIVLF